MPLTMMDLSLWGVDETLPEYIRYWKENVSYLPAALRGRVEVIAGRPSIVRMLEGTYRQSNMVGNETAASSVKAVLDLLTEVMKFRSLHLKVARANMKIRRPGSLGSGGYDVSILELLLGKTRQARRRLAMLVSE